MNGHLLNQSCNLIYMIKNWNSFIYYEPFGLGRFATDHSLTKAAPRPLFARVRRYALKETTKISYLKSACLITPFGRWNQVNPTIFEI